jgi:hypothetical protein
MSMRGFNYSTSAEDDGHDSDLSLDAVTIHLDVIRQMTVIICHTKPLLGKGRRVITAFAKSRHSNAGPSHAKAAADSAAAWRTAAAGLIPSGDLRVTGRLPKAETLDRPVEIKIHYGIRRPVSPKGDILDLVEVDLETE